MPGKFQRAGSQINPIVVLPEIGNSFHKYGLTEKDSIQQVRILQHACLWLLTEVYSFQQFKLYPGIPSFRSCRTVEADWANTIVLRERTEKYMWWRIRQNTEHESCESAPASTDCKGHFPIDWIAPPLATVRVPFHNRYDSQTGLTASQSTQQVARGSNHTTTHGRRSTDASKDMCSSDSWTLSPARSTHHCIVPTRQNHPRSIQNEGNNPRVDRSSGCNLTTREQRGGRRTASGNPRYRKTAKNTRPCSTHNRSHNYPLELDRRGAVWRVQWNYALQEDGWNRG